MIIKNLRPTILFITDAGVRLAPGETKEVLDRTPEINKCLEEGVIVRVHSRFAAIDLAEMSAQEAIALINRSEDEEPFLRSSCSMTSR